MREDDSMIGPMGGQTGAILGSQTISSFFDFFEWAQAIKHVCICMCMFVSS